MASKGVNKAIILGNLGNDPDMRYMPNGTAVVNISVATSESWTDKNTGQPQERTEWHRVEAFGKLAEIMGQYLRKGSQVYIEGSIRTDKYQDKTTGQDRYSTKIRADNMQMLGGRQADASGGTAAFGQQAPQQNMGQGFNQSGGQPAQQAQQAPNQFAQNKFEPPQLDSDDDFGEDIPF